MATKIFIDQGHNPQNPNAGSEGNGYREQDLTFEIGRRLAAVLEANGFETRLSRPTRETQLGTSVSTSLAERVNAAIAFGADYFVSLHTNASVNPQANGAEVLVYSFASPAYELAESVLEQLVLSTGVRGRGVVARPGLYVLRKTPMPAILVEMGFITNPSDAELLANSPGLFAQGIADGIIDYVRRAVPSLSGGVMPSPLPENGEEELPQTEQLPSEDEDRQDSEEKYLDYDDFIARNNEEGALKLQSYRGEQAFPIRDVSVMITKRIGDLIYIFFEGETDESGIIDGIILPAAPKGNSLEFGVPNNTVKYIMRAAKDGYDTIEREVEIFSGVKTVQPLKMMQREGGLYGEANNT